MTTSITVENLPTMAHPHHQDSNHQAGKALRRLLNIKDLMPSRVLVNHPTRHRMYEERVHSPRRRRPMG